MGYNLFIAYNGIFFLTVLYIQSKYAQFQHQIDISYQIGPFYSLYHSLFVKKMEKTKDNDWRSQTSYMVPTGVKLAWNSSEHGFRNNAVTNSDSGRKCLQLFLFVLQKQRVFFFQEFQDSSYAKLFRKKSI